VNFVVDTWVLHRAYEGKQEAIELLFGIYRKHHKVFVDKNGKILTEYRSVPGVFASKWLTLTSSRRIVKIKIRKRCRNILNCRKDMKFVYVCLNCQRVKKIISEDYHFVKNSDKLLKKGIKLLGLDEALVFSR
jgi:hypothetical protein